MMKRRSFLLLTLMLLTLTETVTPGAVRPSNETSLPDRDLDGVADRNDRCPGTPFFAIVNAEGCMIRKLRVSREKELTIKKMLTRKR